MKQCFEEKMKKLFIKALKNSFNMDENDAIALAKTVEEIFNGEKEIEDMTIDKYIRSLFYELEREGLLQLRREEIKEKGKIMRKYYWSFNNKKIKEEAYRIFKEEEWKIYKDIPRDAWVAHITCS